MAAAAQRVQRQAEQIKKKEDEAGKRKKEGEEKRKKTEMEEEEKRKKKEKEEEEIRQKKAEEEKAEKVMLQRAIGVIARAMHFVARAMPCIARAMPLRFSFQASKTGCNVKKAPQQALQSQLASEPAPKQPLPVADQPQEQGGPCGSPLTQYGSQGQSAEQSRRGQAGKR